MNPEKRDCFGRVIQSDSLKVPTGSNAHPHEYFNKVGKQVPTPSCILNDGTPLYAQDGCTQDWATQQRLLKEERR